MKQPCVALVAALCLIHCSSEPAVRAPTAPPSATPPSSPPPAPATTAPATTTEPAALPQPTPRPAPPPIPAARTTVDAQNQRSAPPRYHRITPRAFPQTPARFSDLVYECNNMEFRGPKAGARYADDGATVAARWRQFAAGTGGVFVLRDSLWSQQDHPSGHAAYAPMMPPNWVTVAVAAAAEGRALVLPTAPPVDDDAAWSALTPAAMFGDLPVSDSLHRAAAATGAVARNARRVHRMLTDDVRAMWRAAPAGAEAVAAAGAERIAASDRAYFGAALRRTTVIPIFVEHPNDHEVEEGKGMGVHGRRLSVAHQATAMRAVYRRRLADGDLALERYDLSNAADRDRAIAVLEALIPPGEPAGRGKVWLWITGKLDPQRKLQGDGPLAYVGAFRAQLQAADVDLTRLHLFAKPEIVLPRTGDRKAVLEAAIDAHAQHDVRFSLWAFETTRRLEALFAPAR